MAAGVAYKADSIEELAQVLSMDNLAETVNTYNPLCADKNDTQFHKDARFLYAVGADAGGMYGNSYVMFEGGTLGFTYISGKVAGECAAENALGQ